MLHQADHPFDPGSNKPDLQIMPLVSSKLLRLCFAANRMVGSDASLLSTSKIRWPGRSLQPRVLLKACKADDLSVLEVSSPVLVDLEDLSGPITKVQASRPGLPCNSWALRHHVL